jgi:tRNA-guanine family transglycosylase
MPVGTQASVKALDPREFGWRWGRRSFSATLIICRIRPGMEIINHAGGLHRFMNWSLPILTDSGGFQVFSLAKIRKIKAHGVEFRSHLDGSLLFLGPKEAMEIQRQLGSDIAMVFDECPAHNCSPKDARECRERARCVGPRNAARNRARRASRSSASSRAAPIQSSANVARRRSSQWISTVTRSAGSAWGNRSPK